jgi:hypothetical protein
MALVAFVCVYFSLPQITHVEYVTLLMGQDIRNPEIALQHGIKGYVEIIYPPDSANLSIGRGDQIDIDILLHFVSYTPELTEAHVSIDPKSARGGITEQYLKDARGEFVKDGGRVTLNDFISYNASGNLTIRAGETLSLTMSIRIPENFPKSISAFPVVPLGFWANVPIITDYSDYGKEVVICDQDGTSPSNARLDSYTAPAAFHTG